MKWSKNFNDRNLDGMFRLILKNTKKFVSKFMYNNLKIHGIIIAYLTKIDFCNRFRKLNSLTESDLEFFMLLKGNSLRKFSVMVITCHEIIIINIFQLVPLLSFLFRKTLWSHSCCEYSSLKPGWILNILYFSLLIMARKKLLYFLHFKVMLTLSVTCLIIKIFLEV